jgi:hypothetical protein
MASKKHGQASCVAHIPFRQAAGSSIHTFEVANSVERGESTISKGFSNKTEAATEASPVFEGDTQLFEQD